MNAAALLWLASSALSPHEAACAAALDLSYDGSSGTAAAQLKALNEATPDLLCAYMELLVGVWHVEQTPDSATLDADFHRRAAALIARTDERLRTDPQDARATFVRGATHGVQSRLHFFRLQRRAATSAAVAMREDLLRVPAGDGLWSEAQFGLGLYDYYADVLPRVLKLLRFITGFPAGNRARGLTRMEAARQHASLHATEAQVQLVDAYIYYERRDDDALAELLDLHRRYPGGPLWALRLAEHQRERLGLYAESAATARRILDAAERAEPNYAPVVGGMARVLLAEALLLDLRADLAQAALPPVLHLESAPDWAARARLAQAQISERLGRPDVAREHYRAAALAVDDRVRQAALLGLRQPLSAERAQALALLAEARQRRASGHEREAAPLYVRVLQAWPDSQEAAMRVAEEELLTGQTERARTRLRPLLQDDAPEPPWVKPWSRLLAAQLEDLAGRRGAALELYNQVSKAPLGARIVQERAGAGLRRPFTVASPSPSSH